MRILTYLLITLLSTQAIAQSCPPYRIVKAGESTPCSGVFLNQSINEQVKIDLRDNELRRQQIELKDLQLTEITQDREGWKIEADKQAKLNHSKDNNLRNGIVVGVLTTIAIMFAVQKVGK
jgi:hypothetical protein